jgi:hypothetical protein
MAIMDPPAAAAAAPVSRADGLLDRLGSATAARRRLLLLLTVPAAVALAAWLGEPRPAILADPDLAFVLRGMALIKAAIAAAVFALVWWRAGRPASTARFFGYLTCTTLLATAAILVWKLAVVAATSIVFHAMLLLLGLLSLTDSDLRRRLPQRR